MNTIDIATLRKHLNKEMEKARHEETQLVIQGIINLLDREEDKQLDEYDGDYHPGYPC